MLNFIRTLHFRPTKVRQTVGGVQDKKGCNIYACKLFSTIPINVPTENKIPLTVDGEELVVPSGSTVMQACALAGIDIPRFCYHERLGVAGNCRMCLVQVNGGPKLTASCAAPVMPNMSIETNNSLVKAGREGVMEFLLANHPLDCPICDQGGECDLQDQSMAFGSDRSRFNLQTEQKRAVEDKSFGPLIKTSMNRCIHCTRCVRYANEIAGVQELGTVGRGNDMEISTYVKKIIDSELSGNIIDLCPVGALTSRPYAFAARPWELRRTDSIDVMDAVGSAIQVNSRGLEVMRILPRLNERTNEEWLSDKSRFACDGLRNQRLLQPMLRLKNDVIVPIDWDEALSLASKEIAKRTNKIALVGKFADMESILLTQKIFPAKTFIESKKAPKTNAVPKELLKSLKFDSTMKGISSADHIAIIGSNPKTEAPLLNARLRKAWLAGTRFSLIGSEIQNSTFDYQLLGSDPKSISKLDFSDSHTPAIIVGQSALLEHPNSLMTLMSLQKLAQKYPNLTINMLPTSASVCGALSLSCPPSTIAASLSTKNQPPDLVYLLGSDDYDESILEKDANTFVIYQGTHGDRGAHRADLILPSTTYTEKDASYMNMDGTIQMTRTAVPAPGESREDWMILRALSEYLRVDGCQELDDGGSVRNVIMTETIANNPPSIASFLRNHKFTITKKDYKDVKMVPYTPAINDYYMTDCISRNSMTMAKCSLEFCKNDNNKK